jgi:hypothetical protein
LLTPTTDTVIDFLLERPALSSLAANLFDSDLDLASQAILFHALLKSLEEQSPATYVAYWGTEPLSPLPESVIAELQQHAGEFSGAPEETATDG